MVCGFVAFNSESPHECNIVAGLKQDTCSMIPDA